MRNTAPPVSTLTAAPLASRVRQMMKTLQISGQDVGTSIAILCNPKMGLHRDLLNLRGHPNHAVALGLFTGGRVWVEDENGDAAEEVNMKTKVRSSDPGTTYMTSRLLSTRGAFIKSNLMKGTYTPQAFKWLTNENAARLSSLGFPLSSQFPCSHEITQWAWRPENSGKTETWNARVRQLKIVENKNVLKISY